MAKRSKGLPDRLLIQIGRIATTTAYIEQEFVLWASAIYSVKTGGVPKEGLRMGFQRLLNKWRSEAVHGLDATTVKSFITPLMEDLTRGWPIRNRFIHGRWRHAGRLRYEVDMWEQTKEAGLQHYRHIFPLREIREVADDFDGILIPPPDQNDLAM
jgi:hypothetical protein